MARIQLAFLLATLTLVSAPQLTHAQDNLSREELKGLIKAAHTPQDYRRLEDYFHARAVKFSALESDESAEMVRTQDMQYRTKLPNAYQSAHSLQVYYKQQSEQAASSEKLYREKRIQAEAVNATHS